MADLDLVVTVSRADLGLADLALAPVDRYFVSTQFLGATVTWTRQQVSSPFVDGQVTVQRSRPTVMETVAIEINGATPADLQANTLELLQAFLQDSFVLNVSVDGAAWSYQCEAADYQLASWTTPRLASLRGQVVFQVPRQPVALSGGF